MGRLHLLLTLLYYLSAPWLICARDAHINMQEPIIIYFIINGAAFSKSSRRLLVICFWRRRARAAQLYRHATRHGHYGEKLTFCSRFDLRANQSVYDAVLQHRLALLDWSKYPVGEMRAFGPPPVSFKWNHLA